VDKKRLSFLSERSEVGETSTLLTCRGVKASEGLISVLINVFIAIKIFIRKESKLLCFLSEIKRRSHVERSETDESGSQTLRFL